MVHDKKIKVTFHALDHEGEQQQVGTITWDGEKAISNPPDSAILNELVKEIRGSKDPSKFVKSLHHRYTSSYLRAEVKEL